MSSTRIDAIRNAPRQGQLVALIFLYYLQCLVEGAPPTKTWTRDDLLVLFNTVKGDADVFDQEVVAAFDLLENLTEEAIDEADNT